MFPIERILRRGFLESLPEAGLDIVCLDNQAIGFGNLRLSCDYR